MRKFHTVYLSYDPAMLYQSINPGETLEKDIPNVIHYTVYFFFLTQMLEALYSSAQGK